LSIIVVLELNDDPFIKVMGGAIDGRRSAAKLDGAKLFKELLSLCRSDGGTILALNREDPCDILVLCLTEQEFRRTYDEP